MAGSQADQQEDRGPNADQGDDRVGNHGQTELGASDLSQVLPNRQVIHHFGALPEPEDGQFAFIDHRDDGKRC